VHPADAAPRLRTLTSLRDTRGSMRREFTDSGGQLSQYSTQCFCGNSYGSYGSSSNCNMSCSGDADSDFVCGGTWANSVYQTAP
jgi:hypothetical protein